MRTLVLANIALLGVTLVLLHRLLRANRFSIRGHRGVHRLRADLRDRNAEGDRQLQQHLPLLPRIDARRRARPGDPGDPRRRTGANLASRGDGRRPASGAALPDEAGDVRGGGGRGAYLVLSKSAAGEGTGRGAAARRAARSRGAGRCGGAARRVRAPVDRDAGRPGLERTPRRMACDRRWRGEQDRLLSGMGRPRPPRLQHPADPDLDARVAARARPVRPDLAPRLGEGPDARIPRRGRARRGRRLALPEGRLDELRPPPPSCDAGIRSAAPARPAHGARGSGEGGRAVSP